MRRSAARKLIERMEAHGGTGDPKCPKCLGRGRYRSTGPAGPHWTDCSCLATIAAAFDRLDVVHAGSLGDA